METSFANAGELCYGMTSPWAAPGIPMKAVKWLFMRHRPLFIWPMVDPAHVGLGHADAGELQRGGLPAEQGPDGADLELQPRRDDRAAGGGADIAFDMREQGTLQLFRTEKQLKGSKADQEVLAEYGSPYEVLDRDECIAVEPGLVHVADKFVGGLRLTADRTGDCRMFTLALAEQAAALGVSFRYGNTISGFTHAGEPDHLGRDRARAGDGGRLCLRARALCADPAAGGRDPAADLSDQGLFDHPAGDRRRRGAAVDADGRDPQGGDHPARRPDPGGRAGRDHRLQRQARAAAPPTRCATSSGTSSRRAATSSRAEGWTGLRPMTPDGTPVIGPTRYPNLFLNTGHGTLGWTMACGSGRAVADAVLGQDAGDLRSTG